MGFIFGVFKKIFKLAVYFLIFAALVVLIPNLPPYSTFTKFDVDPTQHLSIEVTNEALNNAKKLFDGKLHGPEAFELYNNEVYTSLATGEVVKISSGGHVTFVTKIGRPCSDIKQEHICGRPLGIVIDKNNGKLYVADAYHGIWKVDIKTDKKQLLVSPTKEIAGAVPKLFNGVALDSRGNLYWTDSSTEFHLKDGVFTLFTDPTARLLKYDAAKNESIVLMDKLWFSNGLAVSPDDQFIVVAETYANKIHKYYINGPKKGKSEVFATGLPGLPDNLRALPDGSGLLAALYTLETKDDPQLSRSLAATPLARKFVARLLRLIEVPFEFLNAQFNHFVFEDVVYYIGHFKTITGLGPKHTGLLQFDWNGKIVAAYLNTDGSAFHVSDAIVFNDKLYLGSPHAPKFIAAVPVPPQLKKAFASKSPKVEAPKAAKVEAPKAAKVEAPKAQPSKPKVEPIKVVSPDSVKQQKAPAPQAAKPTQQPPKPTTPPPEVKKPAPPKVQEKAPEPITTQPPKTEEKIKATTPPPATKKEATTSKPPTTTPTPKAKPSTAKPTEEKAQKPKTQEKAQKPKPITEDIRSDTAKPSKETLKVIKKNGPAEIPNPHL